MTGTRITAGLVGAPTEVDLVVIGLGITGTGVALDAVSRGLSVLAVDAHDLAFGTSRWMAATVAVSVLSEKAFAPTTKPMRRRMKSSTAAIPVAIIAATRQG